MREPRCRKGHVVHQKYDKGSLYGQKPGEGPETTMRKWKILTLELWGLEEPSLHELDGAKTRTVDNSDGNKHLSWSSHNCSRHIVLEAFNA